MEEGEKISRGMGEGKDGAGVERRSVGDDISREWERARDGLER